MMKDNYARNYWLISNEFFDWIFLNFEFLVFLKEIFWILWILMLKEDIYNENFSYILKSFKVLLYYLFLWFIYLFYVVFFWYLVILFLC